MKYQSLMFFFTCVSLGMIHFVLRQPSPDKSVRESSYHRSRNMINRINHFCTLLRNVWHPGRSMPTLLVDRKHRVAYCPLGKVGNTAWREKLVQLSGVPGAFNHSKSLPGLTPRYLKRYNITTYEDLDPQEQVEVMTSYKKFMFVRDPFDRFASGYMHQGQKVMNRESLSVFIRALTSSRTNRPWNIFKNCDFRPQTECCDPCSIKFDFIGHFDHFEEDSYYVLQNLFFHTSIPFLHAPHRTNNTKRKTQTLFSVVKHDDIEGFLFMFKQDILLYTSSHL